jgi:hypothetical protein
MYESICSNLTFYVCQVTCDTAWIGHLHSNPHVSQCKTQIKILTPGTVRPAPADMELNLDSEGYIAKFLPYFEVDM